MRVSVTALALLCAAYVLQGVLGLISAPDLWHSSSFLGFYCEEGSTGDSLLLSCPEASIISSIAYSQAEESVGSCGVPVLEMGDLAD